MFCIKGDNNIGQKKGLCNHLYVVLWVIDCAKNCHSYRCVSIQMLSTYFSAQTTSCKIVMGGLMSLFCTTLMIVVDKVNGDSIWKEGFQMRRTTTCALSPYPKNTNPISSEEWCFVLFCHHQSTLCCLLCWWYIVWKEDWKWDLVQTWDVESNYEQGKRKWKHAKP